MTKASSLPYSLFLKMNKLVVDPASGYGRYSGSVDGRYIDATWRRNQPSVSRSNKNNKSRRAAAQVVWISSDDLGVILSPVH